MTSKLFVIDSANLETTNVTVEAILSRLNLSDYQLVRFLFKLVIFYTEILTRKVVLWSFFTSETSEKIHKSTFQVKISV